MNLDKLQVQATDELQQLGLTETEAACFAALGRLSNGTKAEIAEYTRNSEDEIAETLAGLQKTGLVDVQETKPPKFRAVESDLVARKLQREQEYRLESVAGLFQELEPREKYQSSNGVWTIQGRQNTIDRGQWLVEQAEEELFMMFTLNDLVLDGCIERIRGSLDRGAKVTVGTHNETLQKRISEQAPEVLVWEPKRDWLGLPVADDGMLGRLLMVDREMVMIGSLLDKKRVSGVHRETAVWSRGENSGLVTTVCNIIGSRADALRETEQVDELSF